MSDTRPEVRTSRLITVRAPNPSPRHPIKRPQPPRRPRAPCSLRHHPLLSPIRPSRRSAATSQLSPPSAAATPARPQPDAATLKPLQPVTARVGRATAGYGRAMPSSRLVLAPPKPRRRTPTTSPRPPSAGRPRRPDVLIRDPELLLQPCDVDGPHDIIAPCTEPRLPRHEGAAGRLRAQAGAFNPDFVGIAPFRAPAAAPRPRGPDTWLVTAHSASDFDYFSAGVPKTDPYISLQFRCFMPCLSLHIVSHSLLPLCFFFTVPCCSTSSSRIHY